MNELNWVDFVILAVLLYYALEGYFAGFIASFLDLVSFVLSFIFALKYYAAVGIYVAEIFSIPQGFSNAIGFFIVAFLAETIFKLILFKVADRRILPVWFYSRKGKLRALDKLLGAVPGVFSGLILIAFLLTLVFALPLSPLIKQSVASSKLGSELAGRTQGFEKELNSVFGEAVNETLNFLTVAPRSSETVDLNFQVSDLTVDRDAELQMLDLVNQERAKQGLGEVVFDEQLAEVGRAHCKDMFARGYFSHDTPEGLSPFDRMNNAGISYSFAGENLALAPDVKLAMQGLMSSTGHRENILSPNFAKLGVGAIDGGIYGKMFCQEFTD